MKKQYVAPHAELVGIRLSQGIMDFIIDPNEPIISGGAPAAKGQVYEEDDADSEDSVDFKIDKNIWEEDEE